MGRSVSTAARGMPRPVMARVNPRTARAGMATVCAVCRGGWGAGSGSIQRWSGTSRTPVHKAQESSERPVDELSGDEMLPGRRDLEFILPPLEGSCSGTILTVSPGCKVRGRLRQAFEARPDLAQLVENGVQHLLSGSGR